MLFQSTPSLWRKTEMKGPHSFPFIAALPQVVTTVNPSFIAEQSLMIECSCHFVDLQQALTLLTATYLVGRNRLFLNLNTDLLAKPPDRLREAQSFHTHQEREDIATDSTAKTVKNLSRRINIERRTFFLVERAETLMINARMFERKIAGDHLDNIAAVADRLYFIVCYASHQCLNSTSVTLSPPCSTPAA